MRCFVAIELSEELKQKVAELINEIKGKDLLVANFVKPEQAHITLKFLGEVSEKKVEQLKAELKKFSESANCFELTFGGLGLFGQRVLWIGGENQIASKLAGSLDAYLSKLGFEKDTRPFQVHLTIARIKKIKNRKGLQEILNKYKGKELGKIFVSELVLFKSELKRNGPEYFVLEKYKLKC